MKWKNLKLTLLIICSVNLYAGDENSKVYYVSVSGSDKNNGSISSPFATIDCARDAIRFDRLKSSETSYIIYLRYGIYKTLKTIEFNNQDLFKENSPLIISAYKNETVRLSGGIQILPQSIGSIHDITITKRFITRVKEKIKQIDYSALNINEGNILPHGFGRPYTNTQMELFSESNAYTLARWPNSGYSTYKRVIEKGSTPFNGDNSNKGGILEYDNKRLERWINAEELWISGFFRYGFADDAVAIEKIDFVKNYIFTKQPTFYGFSSGESFNSFYGFNILEEIDLPGEYFVDKKNKKIYFYPFDDENLSDLFLSIIEQPLIKVENSSNIYFEDIKFECTRGMGAYVEGGNNIRFTNCTFRNIGTVAICFGKGVDEKVTPASGKLGKFKEHLYSNQTWNRNCGNNHLVENCEIFNTGAGGIILGGGDRATLEKGNNRVSNCSIRNINRYEKTYRGGINLDGVGNIVDHNEIYNCPGVAIHLNGNDHLIEYNIIHDAVTDGHDMGAIYYGRNPSEQGNSIRYNYFHHIGNKEGTIMSVYHDDGACGMNVYGNIFYKPGNIAVMIGGGNDIIYHNNIFIETNLVFHIDNRILNWGKEEFIGEKGIFRKRLQEVGIDNPPYSIAYPNLANYWTDNLGTPKRNKIENNLFVNIGQLHNGSADWIELGENYLSNADPGFENYAKMNFKLLEDSEVFTVLSNFTIIPFENIGRKKIRIVH